MAASCNLAIAPETVLGGDRSRAVPPPSRRVRGADGAALHYPRDAIDRGSLEPHNSAGHHIEGVGPSSPAITGWLRQRARHNPFLAAFMVPRTARTRRVA